MLVEGVNVHYIHVYDMWEFQFVYEKALWGNDERTKCVVQCNVFVCILLHDTFISIVFVFVLLVGPV